MTHYRIITEAATMIEVPFLRLDKLRRQQVRTRSRLLSVCLFGPV